MRPGRGNVGDSTMNIKKIILFFSISFLLFHLPPVFSVNPLIIKGDKKASEKEDAVSKGIRKELESNFTNYMAIDTGTVKNGEQIPLPIYKYGTKATREECKYLVSPNEITTSLATATVYRGGSFGGSQASSY